MKKQFYESRYKLNCRSVGIAGGLRPLSRPDCDLQAHCFPGQLMTPLTIGSNDNTGKSVSTVGVLDWKMRLHIAHNAALGSTKLAWSS